MLMGVNVIKVFITIDLEAKAMKTIPVMSEASWDLLEKFKTSLTEDGIQYQYKETTLPPRKRQ